MSETSLASYIGAGSHSLFWEGRNLPAAWSIPGHGAPSIKVARNDGIRLRNRVGVCCILEATESFQYLGKDLAGLLSAQVKGAGDEDEKGSLLSSEESHQL